jgi:pyrimidine-specific ribonucleoside hydrolase
MKSWGYLALLGLTHTLRAGSVWIDTDVSIGSPFREVDDAYALVLAFHSPEIRIAGISTTFGNAPLGHTHRAAQALVRRFGSAAELKIDDVFAGAASRRDVRRPTRASEALAATLQKQSVIYVALGPLTNLAAFLELHPKLAHRIERVILIGGQPPGSALAFGPNRSFHIHDANVFKDPAATAAALRSDIPLTLLPVPTVSNLTLDAADLRHLESSGGAANYLSRRSRTWLWFWTKVVREKGGAIFDVPAIIAVAKPELISTEKRYAQVDQAGSLLVRARKTNGSRPVRYGVTLAPGAKRFVMQRLLMRRRGE